jgi:hypothetical protein
MRGSASGTSVATATGTYIVGRRRLRRTLRGAGIAQIGVDGTEGASGMVIAGPRVCA